MPRIVEVAPFEDWKYEDVAKAVKDSLSTDFTIIKAYAVDKDHFQRGVEWVGPGDAGTNDSIKKQFAPEDAVGEVLSNVENAFAEPQLGATPIKEIAEGQAIPTATEGRMGEALALLSDWWDKQRLQEHIQERQRTSAWAGYAGLRLWIPWRFLEMDDDGTVRIRPTTSIEKALKYIYVTAPSPDNGVVLTHVGTQDKCAVFLDKEVKYVNGERQEYPRAELIYLDPDRQEDEEANTVIRIVYADDEKPEMRTELPLGGRLTFTEIRARALLTEPVLRTQRQLNLLTTLVTRIAETAAFRERYTMNAKPQGIRYPYEEGTSLQDNAFIERDEEGRMWQVVPQPRTLGANTTTELIGVPKYDDRGDQKGNEVPQVHIADPVDPKPYLEAADATRRRILRMCSQGHLGGISNAEASGIAYEQARAVFEKDLNKRRVSEEGMLRDLLTSVLALAEHIASKKGYFTDQIRLTVDQHVNAGPRSPDLVRLDLEAREAGAMSRKTVMAKLGIEDIEAEDARVRAEAAFILDLLEKAAGIGATFDIEGVVNVLRELGVPEKLLTDLVPDEPEPVTTGEDNGTPTE